MNPPLLPGGPDSVIFSGFSDSDVDLNGPVGVVQSFTQNSRTVLAISGTDDWSLVDNSFEHIRWLPNQWASLTGDVVAAGPAGQAVNLTVREGGAMAHQPAPAPGWQWWAWFSVAAAGAAVIMAGTIVLIRRRRAKD
jgi:hypothetical protein